MLHDGWESSIRGFFAKSFDVVQKEIE